jgi:DNA-binding transcriptional LysR family regulator
MDWDKVRVFRIVAGSGSFTEAGEILNLSQSSVSRQISALEHDLGVTLFHRHARGLILTEQGELFQKTAEEVFQKLNLAQGQLQDTRHLPEGPLVITVSDFVGTTWLAPRLKKFREMYPQIQLTILFDDRVLNIGMREADAAIRLHKPTDPDLIQRKLVTVNFHICGSKEYLEKRGIPKNAEDLKDHSLLGFPKSIVSPLPQPNWLFDVSGVDIEHDSNIMMMNSMYAVHKAAQTGVGLAALPDYLIKSKDDLVAILDDLRQPSVDMYFAYAEERRNSRRINVFRDFLIDTIHETEF